MAHTLNTKIKTATNPESITYHSNDPKVTTIYTGWTGVADKRYRIQKANMAVLPGNDATVTLYIDTVSQGSITVYHISNDGTTWHGRVTYNGIQMDLYLLMLSTHNVDEDFTLSRPAITLGVNDAKFGTSDVYKIILIDGTGSHIVYQEQLSTPVSLGTVSITQTAITWEIENDDPDVLVEIWGRKGSDAFVKKIDDLAPGNTDNAVFTGLSVGTQYTFEFYAVDTVSGRKITSATMSVNGTTASTTYSWYYINTFSSSQASDYFDDALAGTGYSTAVATRWLNSNYPAVAGNDGETFCLELDQDIFYTFECMED